MTLVGIILSTYSSRRSSGSTNYDSGPSVSYSQFGATDPSYRNLATSQNDLTWSHYQAAFTFTIEPIDNGEYTTTAFTTDSNLTPVATTKSL